MINLTFSKAIPLFFAIQTLAILLLLWIVDRRNSIAKTIISRELGELIVKALYVITIAGIICEIFIEDFILSSLYVVLVTSIPIALILLTTLSQSVPKQAIVTAILWHIMFLFGTPPDDGLAITEGVHMVRTIATYGRWLEELAHNPSYNPFPTMAFVRVGVSYLTGSPWYSWLTALPISLITIISFDLAVLAVTMKLKHDMLLGVLAIIIGAITPYLNPLSHAYQVPANIMVLLALYALIEALYNPRREYAIMLMLLFSSAILTHPTAYIFIIFPLTIPTIFSFSQYISGRSDENARYNGKVLNKVIIAIIVIAIIRFAYETLYVQYINKLFASGLTALTSFITRVFLGELEGAAPTIYDVSGIPVHQAYLWALTAASATVLIIYEVLKRRVNPLHLLLFVTSSIFLALGYLWGAVIKISSQLYRGSYVAFSFLVPLAALSYENVFKRGTQVLTTVALAILIIGLLLAPSDVELSPVGYLKSRGIPLETLKLQPSAEDIVKGEMVLNLLRDVNELSHASFYSEKSLTYTRYTAYGYVFNTTYSTFSQAIWKVMYLKGLTTRDAPVIPLETIAPSGFGSKTRVNDLVVNTGADMVFYKR